jgi:hypothetical protein
MGTELSFSDGKAALYNAEVFPLLASCNEFAETPMEAPLDGCIMRYAYRGTREAHNDRERIPEYDSATVFESTSGKIKSPPEKMFHSVSGYKARVTSWFHRK